LADEEREERRAPAPTAWQDPRFYLSAASVLLTIVLALFGYIATQISTISATLATLSRDSGKQDVRIDKLEEFRRDQERKNEKVSDSLATINNRETDYHFNLSGRLSTLEGAAKKGP
jgi:septal ring factor EnvC (AmiA/AmiB activator)